MSVNDWVRLALMEIIQSPEQEGKKNPEHFLFGSTVEVAETSFIVLFLLYPTESTQNCYLKTHMCVTTPKRTVLPF